MAEGARDPEHSVLSRGPDVPRFGDQAAQACSLGQCRNYVRRLAQQTMFDVLRGIGGSHGERT